MRFRAVPMSSKLRELSKAGASAFEFGLELLYRAFKFVPTLAVMVLLEICLPYFYSGPVGRDLGRHFSENCFHRGWRNLLFIQNYDQPQEMVSRNLRTC